MRCLAKLPAHGFGIAADNQVEFIGRHFWTSALVLA
jgi:hypothetical protein